MIVEVVAVPPSLMKHRIHGQGVLEEARTIHIQAWFLVGKEDTCQYQLLFRNLAAEGNGVVKEVVIRVAGCASKYDKK